MTRRAVALAVALAACVPAMPPATPGDVCPAAEQQAAWWTAGSRAATVVAGAQGLATVPVRSDRGDAALAVGVVVASALAIGTGYLAESSVPAHCRASGTGGGGPPQPLQ